MARDVEVVVDPLVCYTEQRQEKQYLIIQLQEILDYVQQYPTEDQNMVVSRWIDKHAASFRKKWEKAK